jgi:hypothetical protein
VSSAIHGCARSCSPCAMRSYGGFARLRHLHANESSSHCPVICQFAGKSSQEFAGENHPPLR